MSDAAAGKPRVIFHIGEPKTGTTTLQGLLHAHHDDLLSQGIVYARSGRIKPAAIGHHELPRTLWECKSPVDLATVGPWGDLKAELAEYDARHRILVSSEGLSTLKTPMHARMLRDLLDGYETRFVVAVRRPDKWMESIYAQFVKNRPFTLSPFKKFSRNFGLRGCISSMVLADHFGVDRVHVELYGKDIVERMLIALGVEGLSAPPLERSSNRTPAPVINAAYYALNHIDMPSARRLKLYGQIAEYCEQHGNGPLPGKSKSAMKLPRFTFTDEDRKDFLDMHRDSVTAFCTRFGIAEDDFYNS